MSEARIFPWTPEVVGRIEHNLSEARTGCYSCCKSFKNSDFVFSNRNQSNHPTKAKRRHLVCAIFYKVITIEEAKRIADPELHINWSEIKRQVDAMMQERKQVLTASARTLVVLWGSVLMAAGLVISII